ncbi:MAG TPA: poly-gamma-glutamate synthase PgsB, partial [Bacteroidota bacterium]|nr:poly-gamma-glutamate synthase PgsB [Bacteroidota bacterium]
MYARTHPNINGTAVTVAFLSLAAFLCFLAYERITLDRLRRSIPMVIAVTGSRGKSSVVRMLSSVLRQKGMRVLAKTTGSQAQLEFPDGEIKDIPRRGIVSILEQKKILHTAAQMEVDCLIAEIMSIRPENHVAESQQILRPNIVVITNVRRDHLEAMGDTEGAIAEVLKLDVPGAVSVYVPEQYAHFFRDAAMGFPGSALRAVHVERQQGGPLEFSDNVALVRRVADDLGISDEICSRGIQNAHHDAGRLKIWRYTKDGKSVFLVNAFAANDPDSTLEIYNKVARVLRANPSSFLGLLNLRDDRP